MIGKISKGAGFRGCINYVLGKPDAKLLAAEGVLTDSGGRSADRQHSDNNGLFSSPKNDETTYPPTCGTYITQLCTRRYFKNDR